MALFPFLSKKKADQPSAPVPAAPESGPAPFGAGTGAGPFGIAPGGAPFQAGYPQQGVPGSEPQVTQRISIRPGQRPQAPLPPPVPGKGRNTAILATQPVQPGAGPGQAGGDTIMLPLGMILKSVPREVLQIDPDQVITSPSVAAATVHVPAEHVIAQLPSGSVAVNFEVFRNQIPPQFLAPEPVLAAAWDTPVKLPLAELVNRIPQTLMARRTSQRFIGQEMQEIDAPFTPVNPPQPATAQSAPFTPPPPAHVTPDAPTSLLASAIRSAPPAGTDLAPSTFSGPTSRLGATPPSPIPTPAPGAMTPPPGVQPMAKRPSGPTGMPKPPAGLIALKPSGLLRSWAPPGGAAPAPPPPPPRRRPPPRPKDSPLNRLRGQALMTRFPPSPPSPLWPPKPNSRRRNPPLPAKRLDESS